MLRRQENAIRRWNAAFLLAAVATASAAGAERVVKAVIDPAVLPKCAIVRFEGTVWKSVPRVRLSRSGRWLAASTGRETLVWDEERAGFQAIPSKGTYAYASFSPVDESLATAQEDFEVHRYEQGEWRRVVHKAAFRGEGKYLSHLDHSPNGKCVLAVDAGEVSVFKVESGDLVWTAPDELGATYGASFSSDGSMIGASTGESPTVWLWPSARPRLPPQVHGAVVIGFVFLRDDVLWSRRGRSPIFCRHLPSGKTREWRLPGENEGHIAASPDEGLLATGCDHQVTVWDLATGKELMRIPPHSDWLTSLTLSSGGGRLALAHRTVATLWDLPALVRHRMTESQNEREDQLDDDGLWNDLASWKPQEAFRASWKLAGRGETVVGWIEAKLAAEHPSAAEFAGWMKTLAEGDAAAQDAAEEKIRAAAWRHVGLLQKGIEAATTLDTRTRLQIALALLEPLPLGKVSHSQMRRAVRVVRLLEVVRTPEARKLIAKLAEVEAPTVRDAARNALVRWPLPEAAPPGAANGP